MIEVIRKITDKVQLIKHKDSVYILKNYDTIEAKNNLIKFIDILNKNQVGTIQYFNFDFLEYNQLCLEYIPKFHTFDKKKSEQDYCKVGAKFKTIHSILGILGHGIGNLENHNIMIIDNNVFFLNPNFGNSIQEDIDTFLGNNLSKSKYFTASLNQQETRQNEFLELFINELT